MISNAVELRTFSKIPLKKLKMSQEAKAQKNTTQNTHTQKQKQQQKQQQRRQSKILDWIPQTSDTRCVDHCYLGEKMLYYVGWILL